jgi:hypothetical protein
VETANGKRATEQSVLDLAQRIAAQLDAYYGAEAALATRLNAAQSQLQRAKARLWLGLHPDGPVLVYGEDPGAVDLAFAEHRSEVLGARDPFAAIQQVHREIHGAFITYQIAAEERRQLAAEIFELIRQLVDALVAVGWSEEQARNPNVRELASNSQATQERN